MKRPAASVGKRRVLKRPASAAAREPEHMPNVHDWAEALDLGPDDNGGGSGRTVYLITFARLLPATTATTELRDPSALSREEVLEAVRDPLDNPVHVHILGGRPCAREGTLVFKALVVQEQHADKSFHFHVGVKLSCLSRFAAARRTLEVRYSLASHWSTSHTQWWSVVRYMTHTSPKKLSVDSDYVAWAAPDVEFNVFEDAQEPF